MSSNIRMGNVVLVGAEQEPPLFDWRRQLEHADYIIAQLKKPIPPRIGSRRKKPSPGLDLGDKRESLARFLAELHEGYVLACHDHEMRSDQNKPHRKLEDNWTKTGNEAQYPSGADTGLGHEWSWDEFWLDVYGRGAGNPGRNRTATRRADERPPIEPLRLNCPAIVRWWKEATGGGFSPEFARTGAPGEADEPFERNNPPARFLILVAQELDTRFDPANARGLVDTMKRQKKERKRKAEE